MKYFKLGKVTSFGKDFTVVGLLIHFFNIRSLMPAIYKVLFSKSPQLSTSLTDIGDRYTSVGNKYKTYTQGHGRS